MSDTNTPTVGLAGVVVPDGYVDLGPHMMAGRYCAWCKSEIADESYEEYVAWFYAKEWEGEPDHTPGTEQMFAYLAATCVGNPSNPR